MALLKREISIVCCNLLGLQINRQVQFKLKFTFKIAHDRQFKRKKNQFKVSLLAKLVQLVDKKRLLFMIVSLKKKTRMNCVTKRY